MHSPNPNKATKCWASYSVLGIRKKSFVEYPGWLLPRLFLRMLSLGQVLGPLLDLSTSLGCINVNHHCIQIHPQPSLSFQYYHVINVGYNYPGDLYQVHIPSERKLLSSDDPWWHSDCELGSFPRESKLRLGLFQDWDTEESIWKKKKITGHLLYFVGGWNCVWNLFKPPWSTVSLHEL